MTLAVHKYFLDARRKSEYHPALFFVHHVKAGGFNWLCVTNGWSLHAQRTEQELEEGALFLPTLSDGRRRQLVQVKDNPVGSLNLTSIIEKALASLKSCVWLAPRWNTDKQSLEFLDNIVHEGTTSFITHNARTNTYSLELASAAFWGKAPDAMAFNPAYISTALRWIFAAGSPPDACGTVVTTNPTPSHQIVIASGGGEGSLCARLAVVMGMAPPQKWYPNEQDVNFLSYPNKEKEESLVSTTVEPDGSLSS